VKSHFDLIIDDDFMNSDNEGDVMEAVEEMVNADD